MPGNLPISIGTGAQVTGTAVSSYAMTTTAAVAATDAILVAYEVYASGVTVASASDGTNSYDVATVSANTPSNFRVGIAYILSSAGLASGGTITITMSGVPGVAVGHYAISAFKVVGGLLALDVSATATQTTATALSVGPTGATAQAIELVMGIFGLYSGAGAAPAFTVGAGYTVLTAASATGAPYFDGVATYPEYLVTSSTGTQTATGTLGAAVNTGDVVAAFTYPATALYAPRTVLQAVNRSTRWHHREPMRRRGGLLVPSLLSYLPGKTGLRKAA